jgi:hypothetical protein
MDEADTKLAQTPLSQATPTPWRRPIVDGRRFMVRVMAIRLARQIVKEDLKRRNCMPSHYAQAEISRMAQQYLETGNWQRLMAEALEKIMASPHARLEYLAAGEKYELAMARAKKKVA